MVINTVRIVCEYGGINIVPVLPAKEDSRSTTFTKSPISPKSLWCRKRRQPNLNRVVHRTASFTLTSARVRSKRLRTSILRPPLAPRSTLWPVIFFGYASMTRVRNPLYSLNIRPSLKCWGQLFPDLKSATVALTMQMV